MNCVQFRKIIKKLLGSTVLLLFVVSCAALPGFSALSSVYITDHARYKLLSPAEIERPLDRAQMISGTWGGDEFIMEAWVQADRNGIDMELYNNFGAGMGSFSFDGNGVFFDSPIFPRSFKAEYLAADFQFCFYRADAVAAAAKKCGLVFEMQTEDNGRGETRRIFDGDNLVIEIIKKGTTIQYTNFFRGYTFSLWEAE